MTQLLSEYLPILQNETEEYRNRLIGDITFGLSGQATMVQMQHFVRLANLRKQIVPSCLNIISRLFIPSQCNCRQPKKDDKKS